MKTEVIVEAGWLFRVFGVCGIEWWKFWLTVAIIHDE